MLCLKTSAINKPDTDSQTEGRCRPSTFQQCCADSLETEGGNKNDPDDSILWNESLEAVI